MNTIYKQDRIAKNRKKRKFYKENNLLPHKNTNIFTKIILSENDLCCSEWTRIN